MPQPEQLMPPETNFPFRNNVNQHSTTSPLVTPADHASVTSLDARLTAISLGKMATAVAAGTTTTMVINSNEAYRVPNGSLVEIRDSSNALKATGSGKTVSGVAANTPSVGLTTVTFGPAAAGATASGDYLALTTKPFGGSYPTSVLNQMTVNDKQYAIRVADDASSV